MARLSRRDVLRFATTSGIVACAPGFVGSALARGPAPATNPPAKPMTPATPTMNTRPIPRTKEAIPTVGLGTWQAFDVDPAGRAPLVEVVRQFLAAGGGGVGSASVYGRAEGVVGDVLADLGAESI